MVHRRRQLIRKTAATYIVDNRDRAQHIHRTRRTVGAVCVVGRIDVVTVEVQVVVDNRTEGDALHL